MKTRKPLMLALMLAITVSLFMAFTITASAQDHTDHQGWTPINETFELGELQSGENNYYLTSDSVAAEDYITHPIEIGEGVTLNICLNGHTFDLTQHPIIFKGTGENAKVNISDCTGNGTVKGSSAHPFALYANGAAMSLEDICIDTANTPMTGDNSAPLISYETDVKINNVEFKCAGGNAIMTGGSTVEIKDTTANSAQFVITRDGSEVRINSGTIDGTLKVLDDSSNIKVYGGSFGSDPSACVADGFEAVEKDGRYEVTLKQMYEYELVFDATQSVTMNYDNAAEAFRKYFDAKGYYYADKWDVTASKNNNYQNGYTVTAKVAHELTYKDIQGSDGALESLFNRVGIVRPEGMLGFGRKELGGYKTKEDLEAEWSDETPIPEKGAVFFLLKPKELYDVKMTVDAPVHGETAAKQPVATIADDAPFAVYEKDGQTVNKWYALDEEGNIGEKLADDAEFEAGKDYAAYIAVTPYYGFSFDEAFTAEVNGAAAIKTQLHEDGAIELYAKVTAEKAANTLYAKGKTVKLKAKALKKKAKVVARKSAITIKNANGKVTYKLSSVSKSKFKKYFKVSSAGKITVKKGLKKGAYKVKIKVTAKGDAGHLPISKTATVTVRVK